MSVFWKEWIRIERFFKLVTPAPIAQLVAAVQCVHLEVTDLW